MTENEEVLDQVVVRVWKSSQLWIAFLFFPLLSLLPFADALPWLIPVITLPALWYMTYFIRQRWRLTLTNRQIVARQLLPRPLTALSPIYYFPLHNIEGLSVGPRAFRSILLVGIFISTNLGVTLLKSGLSPEGYDLPDLLEAILLIMRGINFLPFLAVLADQIESGIADLLSVVSQTLIVLGIVFIVIGILTVILTIPRRFHLQIRMRHSRDFKLSAGIPKSFWKNCYRQLYGTEIVDAPSQYKRWNFPWLEGEEMQTSADLEEIVYLNRFISLFAIYIGSLRIWNRVHSGTLGVDVELWLVVAATDILIAMLAVYFSKKRNEMVVTNRRIIFAQEMRDLSGAFGRRLFLMSDIGRDDVAGFHVSRIKGLSYRYLFLTIFTTIVTVYFWKTFSHTFSGIFIRLVFVLVILLFFTFINQTYIQFDLKTKGHELWHMRHQLSNPLTFMRQLVGNDENRLLTTIMSNRLEEKEVVDTTQIIRSGDIGLKPRLFEDSKYFGDQTKPSAKKKRRNLVLEDLLLENEKIQYEANVSRGVPHRILNLSISSLFMLSLSAVYIVPFVLSETMTYINAVEFFSALSFLVAMMMIMALWVKYYSFFKARIVVTEQRVFFLDVKQPPLLLYLLGIVAETRIDETLQDQIHSTYSSRQFTQQQYWRDLVYHFVRFIMSAMVMGISIAVLVALDDKNIPPEFTAFLLPIVLLSFYLCASLMIWHIGNSYIAFIRSLPKRVVHTKGIGSHFIVPFASKDKADMIAQTVWNGIITE